MDTLILIGIVLGVVGLVFLVSFLMKKYKLSNSDITEGVDVTMTTFRLIKAIAKDAKLGDDKVVDEISKIVIDGLEYVKSIPNAIENKQELIDIATKYSIDIAETEGLIVDQNRQFIIQDLVTVGINLYFIMEEK